MVSGLFFYTDLSGCTGNAKRGASTAQTPPAVPGRHWTAPRNVYRFCSVLPQIALANIRPDDREQVTTDGIVRWRRNIAECDFRKDYQTFARLLCTVSTGSD